MSKKRLLSRAEVDVDVWEERDRLSIVIKDKKTGQRTIAEWWDDDARQMFEDGFFKRGVELKRSVIGYAEDMGLLSKIGRNPYGKVRENIFLFNNPGKSMSNPGNAQKILAENFVKGANSGVASSLYIHGNRIYSYGPHFPIAERRGDSILIRHPSKKAPSKTTAGHISLVVNAARQVFSPDSIIYDTAGELSAEAKGPAAFSNPGVKKNARFLFNPKEPKQEVRENIFLFNNPRELNSVESAAAAVGLVVGTWAPGDGITRYRFFLSDGKSSYGDYHQGDGLYTALGRKDALAFVSAYGKGRSARTNPLSKGEARVVLADARHEQFKGEASTGPSRAFAIGRATGMRDVERKFGPYGFMVGPGSVCSNPIVRGDKLPARLQDEALRRYIYRWTTGNDRRGHAYGYCPHCKTQGGRPSETNIACRQVHPTIPLISDVEWLKTHAFHITKDGRFSERHNHAEPGYMADTEGGGVRSNPPSSSVRAFRVPGGCEAKVASMLRNAFIWAQARSGEVLTVARPEVVKRAIAYVRSGKPIDNPLLQTVMMANPPISSQWDRMTGQQRLHVLGFVGFDETASRYVRLPWKLLSDMVKQALEQYWNDTSITRGTTRRRLSPVGANPLTRRESSSIIREAKRDIRYGSGFRSGDFTRTVSAGQAFGKSKIVRKYGPKSASRAAAKIADKSHKMAGTIFSNPGSVRLPKPGTKLTVAQALDLAQRIGDRGLIEQCQKALKLQKAANKNAKCVIWKTFPMGSSDKIDSVVALTHYGDSPETMYQPPKGSKKGNHMYRHKWGETGGKRSVPLLASADGKMLLMPLEGKKVASDWLRH
jgi:hypothetical protein